MIKNNIFKKRRKYIFIILSSLLIGIVVTVILFTQNTKGKNLQAEANLSLLMKQVENKTIDIENLGDKEYIELGIKTSEYINLIGEVASIEVHYFRGYFSRAPQTLSDMITTIKSGNSVFKWHLMLPQDTTFHMYGEDGAFNVKFVSEDGFFEAIYNKKGDLLTKDNNPLNMGTFNYASPINDKSNHTKFDVVTYFRWGNAANDKLSFLNIDPATNDHLEPQDFHENRNAVKRYKKLYKLLYGKEYVEVFE